MIFGSLFGAKGRAETPRLGLYGKLPLSKEFLRIRCSEGAGHAFHAWVNAGFDREIAQGSDARVGHWRLLFQPEGYGETVVATLRDSADAGEERAFPYAVFALTKTGSLGSSTSEALGRAAGLFDALEALDGATSSAADRAELHSILGAQAWSVPDDGPDLAATPVRLEPQVADQLHELVRGAHVLAAGVIPGERLPALRLPLADRRDAAASTVALLSALERLPILAQRNRPVTVAVPADGGSHAWLVPRPPRPTDYGMLGALDVGALHPDPGGEVVRLELEPRAAFLERLERTLGDGATLADLAAFAFEPGAPA